MVPIKETRTLELCFALPDETDRFKAQVHVDVDSILFCGQLLRTREFFPLSFV
jgi:hypothetical protein